MRSLGLRLALWYGLSVAFALLLLGAFLYGALGRYLTEQSLNLLRSEATPLQRFVSEQSLPARDGPELRQIAAQLVERPAAGGVGVTVLGPSSSIAGQSAVASGQNMTAAISQQLRTLRQGRTEESAITRVNGQRYLLLLRPLTNQNRLAGALVLSISLAPVDTTLHTFVLILLIGIAGAITVVGVIVFLVTRLGLAPLRDMSRTARRIAEGDLSQRVEADEQAADEVSQLAKSFNHMAESLQRSWEAQRQFAADASHELRTPLTSLAGYIDVLQKGAKGDPGTLDRVLVTMRGEVERMTRLVRDLISLVRLEGAEDLQLERIDLAGLVGEVYEQTKAMAPDRQVSFDAAGPAYANVDADRLRQVILNLADNAVKYTPPQAPILFRVTAAAQAACLEVADGGPGIPPEARAHLFDRFYRAERSRARDSGGAGLGLAIAKRIVEAHGGTITVSCPPEGGTTFCVRLPQQ